MAHPALTSQRHCDNSFSVIASGAKQSIWIAALLRFLQ